MEDIEDIEQMYDISAQMWHGNDIYLEDAAKQVKAVCSNKDIAAHLAKCYNDNMMAKYAVAAIDNKQEFLEFFQAAKSLAGFIKLSNIAINSKIRAAMNLAFDEFCRKLAVIEQLVTDNKT